MPSQGRAMAGSPQTTPQAPSTERPRRRALVKRIGITLHRLERAGGWQGRLFDEEDPEPGRASRADRHRRLDRLVDRYFWQEGRDFFHSQTSEAAQHWFYRAWCTREALLKYRGEGNLFRALGSPLALAFPTEARVGQTEQLTLATVFDGPGEPDVVVAGAGRDGRLSFSPPKPSGPLPQLGGLVAAPPGPV